MTTPFTESTPDIIERSLREGDVAGLIAHDRALAELPWSSAVQEARRIAALALASSPKADGLLHVLQSRLADCVPPIQGLLLQPGDALAMPFEDNPWEITEDMSLADALETIWGPVDEYAPSFVRALHERTLGLALFRSRSRGPCVGYLAYVASRSEDGARTLPKDRRTAPALACGIDVIFAGRAPSPSTRLPDGTHIPRVLWPLYAAHGGIDGNRDPAGWSGVAGPEDLTRWSEFLGRDPSARAELIDEDPDLAAEDGDVLLGNLRFLCGYGDDRSDLLDLTDPNHAGVRQWLDGGLAAEDAEPFWKWFQRVLRA